MATQQFSVSELADVLARAARAAQDMGHVHTADEVKAMTREELQRDPALRAAWQRGWNDRGAALDQALRTTAEPQRKRAKQAPPSRAPYSLGKPSTSTTTKQAPAPGTVKATLLADTSAKPREKVKSEKARNRSYQRFQELKARRKAQKAEAGQSQQHRLAKHLGAQPDPNSKPEPAAEPKAEGDTAPPPEVPESMEVDQQAAETATVLGGALETAAAGLALEEEISAFLDTPATSTEGPGEKEPPPVFGTPPTSPR